MDIPKTWNEGQIDTATKKWNRRLMVVIDKANDSEYLSKGRVYLGESGVSAHLELGEAAILLRTAAAVLEGYAVPAWSDRLQSWLIRNDEETGEIDPEVEHHMIMALLNADRKDDVE
jgi:hypothetical protein